MPRIKLIALSFSQNKYKKHTKIAYGQVDKMACLGLGLANPVV
jgi:hypothetical protein